MAIALAMFVCLQVVHGHGLVILVEREIRLFANSAINQLQPDPSRID